MASTKKGQRKRKSAGVCDIFEVNERDLSPEPPDGNDGEPKVKIQKTTECHTSEPQESNNLDKCEPQKERLNNNVTTDSTEQVSSPTVDSNTVILLEDSMSTSDVINIEEENSDSDVVVGRSNDALEGNVTETVAAEVKHSIAIENVSPNLMDRSEVLSLSQNSINSDIECTDTLVNKDIIIINSESTNDNLEDGEVDEVTEEPNTSNDGPEPVITIQFRDSSISDMYKHKFLKLIQEFVELNPKDSGNVIQIFRDESIDPKDWVVLDGTVCIKDHSDDEILAQLLPATPKENSPKKKKKRKKSHSAPDLFVVDTRPAVDSRQLSLTKYSTKFSIDDEKYDKKSNPNKPSFSAMCFNCEQEHSLKDCPVPKNFAKINANRQRHQNKSKSSRYHLEEDQKYSHLQPGKLSTALRKALGLRKHQVPAYVYRMRVLGYPPGWLEEAQYVKSDLAMFDIHGKSVRNTSAKRVQGLDPEKVIDYCGFNVPLEKGFKDEYKYYHVPQFSDHFRKENMIDVFNKMAARKEDDFETLDMDLDTSDILTEVTNQSEVKKSEYCVDSDSNDPISLLELEKQKNSLLAEIKKAEEIAPWDPPTDNSNTSREIENSAITIDDSPIKEVEERKPIVEGNISNLKESNTEVTRVEDKTSSKANDDPDERTPKATSVKCSVFGTPIIKSCSPYDRLPNPDNFMKGVSPVIDFENLPNSTGKYEQMTGVLQKVRNTLKGLQKSDT